MIVIDADSKTVKTTARDIQAKNLMNQLLDHVILGVQKYDQVIEQEDTFVIQHSVDMRTNTKCLEMWGTLDNGYWYMLRSPLEGIRDSAQIANRFLAYVGIFALVAGATPILLAKSSYISSKKRTP